MGSKVYIKATQLVPYEHHYIYVDQNTIAPEDESNRKYQSYGTLKTVIFIKSTELANKPV